LPNVTDRRHSTQSVPAPAESMTPSEESRARLLQKLAHWLIAQPEYPAIFLDNRKTRRDFARKAATIIATIPKVRVK
jgi:hypothetical protein